MDLLLWLWCNTVACWVFLTINSSMIASIMINQNDTRGGKCLSSPYTGWDEMLIDIFQTLKTGEQLHYLQNWIIIILIPSFLWLSDYELVLRTNMSPIHTRSLQYYQLRVQKNSIIVTTQCKKCVSASSAAELYVHPIIDYIRLDDCWLHLTTYTCINQHQHKHQAST